MRRVVLILLALLVVGALGHAALWWVATDRLIAEAGTAIAAERAAGATLTHAPPVRGGYPLDARVRFSVPRYAGAVSLPGGGVVPVAAEAQAVTLVLSPRRPREIVADIACPCRLGAGSAAPVTVEAASLAATVPLVRGGAPVVDGRDMVFELPEGPLAVRSLRASVPAERRTTVAFEAWGVTLPPPEAQWPLGRELASVSAEATLRGLIPAASGTARSLALWRDQGGALVLDRVWAVWGPLSVRAAGTLTLDAGLQPRGAVTAWLAGFGAALDRLVAAGLIGRGPAALARLALTATSRPGEGGERVAEIPITIEDQVLTAARVPLLRLPPVVWPDPLR
ncbi:DUF2125 domain-containing protein [Elioraea rosea]|uniref:DUF2125 domain-containing protein n=1 Tax=Elioraea rosea TaxID=2492390 RepID=UPI001182D320|nr:DUF2125 domain-containing protein [Elioraea rosea]